ncbi:hypothetical protein EJD97_014998 [Solanum chilense]|uniref:Tf2-1-like SH3-like domain-containing protein n=1 Tax=Solanum chilense TaxID=4083 RepID=A0A6N2BCQ5_SOLCI|nr:hypothetical protein EJD97_014998 [Solanum chilense]
MSVLYHPDKSNVVVDALSRLSISSVSHINEAKKYQVKDVHRFLRLGVRLEHSPNGGFMVHHNFKTSLEVEVKSKQHLHQPLMDLKESVLSKLNESLSLGGNRVLRYQGRLWFPNVDGLRNSILEEAHGSRYSIHPGSTKMYHDLREVVGRHFSLVEFCYYNNFHSSTSMAPYELFYSMRFRPPIGWFEVGESSLLVPNFIYKTLEKVHIIRNWLETPYSRHKSYVDHRVGPYEILQRVGKVAYELKLPSELASVHLVFHVSKLKKCISDPESILPIEGLGVKDNLSYEEILVQILDSQVNEEQRGSFRKGVMEESPSKGAKREDEDDMMSCYRHLFDN